MYYKYHWIKYEYLGYASYGIPEWLHSCLVPLFVKTLYLCLFKERWSSPVHILLLRSSWNELSLVELYNHLELSMTLQTGRLFRAVLVQAHKDFWCIYLFQRQKAKLHRHLFLVYKWKRLSTAVIDLRIFSFSNFFVFYLEYYKSENLNYVRKKITIG